jgi:uncharacterized membrane protein
MKRLAFIIIILVAATISGCYYDSEEKLYPVLDTSCNLDNVTFSGTVKPILQASCYRCHSNANTLNLGGGIKLENHTDVQSMANSGKLMGVVTHASGFIPMPQEGGKLSDCEISQLQRWVDNQTPNN